MMENQLLLEVKSLEKYKTLMPLNTVGYKELFEYLDGKTDLQTAVELIKRNTRRYARKQITWFKRDEDIRWFHPSQQQEIMNYISQYE